MWSLFWCSGHGRRGTSIIYLKSSSLSDRISACGGVNLFESPIVSHFDNVNVVANRIVKMKKLPVQNGISLNQFLIVLRKLLRFFECRYTERISGAVIASSSSALLTRSQTKWPTRYMWPTQVQNCTIENEKKIGKSVMFFNYTLNAYGRICTVVRLSFKLKVSKARGWAEDLPGAVKSVANISSTAGHHWQKNEATYLARFAK